MGKLSTMKNYIVFAGETFYPNGGFKDFLGSFASIKEAKDALLHHDEEYCSRDWWQICSFEDEQFRLIEHGRIKELKA